MLLSHLRQTKQQKPKLQTPDLRCCAYTVSLTEGVRCICQHAFDISNLLEGLAAEFHGNL